MLSKLNRLNQKVITIESNITFIFLAVIVLLVFIAAVSRSLGYPFAWMGDISKLLFGWVVFLGSDLAMINNKHIGVEFIEEKLPYFIRKILSVLWRLLMIMFLLFSSYYASHLIMRNRREFDSLMISDLLLTQLFLSSIIAYITCFHLKKPLKIKITFFILLTFLMVTITQFLPIDKSLHSLSYSYLILSIPVGCLLMTRSIIFQLFNIDKIISLDLDKNLVKVRNNKDNAHV